MGLCFSSNEDRSLVFCLEFGKLYHLSLYVIQRKIIGPIFYFKNIFYLKSKLKGLSYFKSNPVILALFSIILCFGTSFSNCPDFICLILSLYLFILCPSRIVPRILHQKMFHLVNLAFMTLFRYKMVCKFLWFFL